MFIPSKFKVKDNEQIIHFLQDNLFGTLVVNGKSGFPSAVHIPFNCLIEGGKTFLVFHVDNQNEIIQAIDSVQKGKLIVIGNHGYISSAVYSHINAPTYNYEAAHASGFITKLTRVELVKHLADLVAVFEKGRETPLTMEYWSTDFMEANLQLITGYKLEVESIECAFKLSQNRNDVDHERIVEDLSKGKSREQALAESMKINRNKRS